MSRLLQHLKTGYVGCITSFVTSDNSDRTDRPTMQSKKKNKASNKQLSKALQSNGFGFYHVAGAYKEENSNAVASEDSYFVICPEGMEFEDFTEALKRLAKKFEQESIVVWNGPESVGYLLGTTDFRTYKKWATFKSFSINKVRDVAWTEYRNHWFAFNENLNWIKVEN